MACNCKQAKPGGRLIAEAFLEALEKRWGKHQPRRTHEGAPSHDTGRGAQEQAERKEEHD